MRYMLSIDPGLNGTGVVYWFQGKPKRAQVLYPLTSQKDNRQSLSDDVLVQRARSVARRVIDFTNHSTKRVYVVIEFPEFQEGLRGMTARRTGSLDKLSFLVGVMVGEFPHRWVVSLPFVREWKGQLPKDVVIRRMERRYGKIVCAAMGVRTHAWDALGIGHWFIHQKGK